MIESVQAKVLESFVPCFSHGKNHLTALLQLTGQWKEVIALRRVMASLLVLLFLPKQVTAQVLAVPFLMNDASQHQWVLSRVLPMQGDSSTSERTESHGSGGVWLKGGIGSCSFGLTSVLGAGYAFRNNILSFRHISAEEFRWTKETSQDEQAMKYEELGVLYGRSFREKNVMLWSFSVGLGLMNGVERGKLIQNRAYEEAKFSGVCIPFEGSVRVEIWALGIGGTVFGSVNSNKTFLGWTVELYIGVFRI